MVIVETNTVTLFHCAEHGLNIQHNPKYHGSDILYYLAQYGWGYEFQDDLEDEFDEKTVYYCPNCLKELNLKAGQVDIRQTTNKI